jgi:CheY-like chemotaxis protein/anti-sigma regulatory factor (Ser/Thr protein kinase)
MRLESRLDSSIDDARALVERVERLERAVRARDETLALVAHDLRNPLTVISIAARSQLKREGDAAAQRTLERILRAAQRAARIVEDLLNVQAIEEGRFSIETATVPAAGLVLSALASQHGPAAQANVILASDLSPGLPMVEADEARVLEVLENLIGNALKFTPPGGTVTVGATALDQEVVVHVRDSGRGIPPEQLPHVFDRYWQAKKAERRGSGLGLTICKAIVEAHCGRIWAESVVGEGTTMSFTLPATSAERESSANAIANVLLVDDRPENLLSLRAILERPEYRLLTASSGEEALRIALREQLTVALVDVAMPGMSGLEVAAHMGALERSRDVPIVFITAFGDDPEEIHRAYGAGGVDYLVKPLDPEIVRKKVAVFVDLGRRRRNQRLRLREATRPGEE